MGMKECGGEVMELFCNFTVITELYAFVKTLDKSLGYMVKMSKSLVKTKGKFAPPTTPDTSGNV